MTDTTLPDETPHWAERMSHSRIGLAVLSFLESTLAPIPIETLLVPLMLAYPRSAWIIATATLAGSLVGATLMYFLGMFAFDWLRDMLSGWIDFAPADEFIAQINGETGFWTVFLIAVGPIPMQMATLGAGAAQLGFITFLGAIALSRGLRYYGLALACYFVGERIQHLKIRKRTTVLFTTIFLLLLWGGYELFISAD